MSEGAAVRSATVPRRDPIILSFLSCRVLRLLLNNLRGQGDVEMRTHPASASAHAVTEGGREAAVALGYIGLTSWRWLSSG